MTAFALSSTLPASNKSMTSCQLDRYLSSSSNPDYDLFSLAGASWLFCCGKLDLSGMGRVLPYSYGTVSSNSVYYSFGWKILFFIYSIFLL